MKKYVAIVLMSLISTVMNAQSDIWVNGTVHTEVDGKQIMVPFATVCVYDYAQTDDMKHFAVCGPHGNYHIKPYDHKQQYHYVVSAPGFKDRAFNLKAIPETLNGKPFSGNRTVNIKMESIPNGQIPEYKKIVYHLDDLKKKGQVKSIEDALSQISEIKKEGNDWIDTQSDGSVCFFLNGSSITAETYAKLESLPAEAIADIEYYGIPDGSAYSAAVNIHLTMGQSSKAPDYTLDETDLMF